MTSLLVVLLLASDGGITASTWEHHPDIESARAVYQEVRAALEAKRLTAREAHDCSEEFTNYTRFADADGTTRLLEWKFGGEDSAQAVESYYDAAGRLRFVFVKVGAVPSAWVEARFWLDARGRLLWKTRATGGEGPTYYAQEPGPYLIKKPDAWVARRTQCRPVK